MSNPQPTLGSVTRRYGGGLAVVTPALLFGDWAAHPTGHVRDLVCDPDSQETVSFVEWAITHVPSGRTPSPDVSLAWYHAVRLAHALDQLWTAGSPQPDGPADGLKFRAALYACQAEKHAEMLVPMVTP